MRKPIKLTITDDQEHALYEIAFAGRKTGGIIRVKREALQALLIDFGRVLAALPNEYLAGADNGSPSKRRAASEQECAGGVGER